MEPAFPDVLRLARISAAVAVRDERKLKRELQTALRAKVSVEILRETILQTYLFAGYAAAINAFVLLNQLTPGDERFLTENYGSIGLWRSRGKRLCRTIYRDQYDKLVRNMSQLHPDLADWMILEGYGKVLSRPFLSPRVRELLIVGMTAVLEVERQFHSHVKGALHTGAMPGEVRAIVSAVNPYMGDRARARFQKILESIL